MNVLDFLILAMFVGIAATGFYAGVARMASLMVAMYFGTVISATFYERFGDSIQSGMGRISEGAAYFAAFVILFVGITLLFTFVIVKTTHPVSTQRRFAIFDNMGGATLSVVVAFVAITMAMAITVVMIQAAQSVSIGSDTGLMGSIETQLESSELAPIFLRLMPFVTAAVRPWFPGGLPPILTEADI